MTTPAKPADVPVVTSAEGADLPLFVPVQINPDAPTLADYRAEWGKYRATMDLPYGTAIAVAKGGAVPASHPLLAEWMAAGMVELVPTD